MSKSEEGRNAFGWGRMLTLTPLFTWHMSERREEISERYISQRRRERTKKQKTCPVTPPPLAVTGGGGGGGGGGAIESQSGSR